MNDLLVRVAGVLIAAVGSAGFVAGVGGAVLWARFHAAELPADQAVAAVPNQELVVVGAVALVGFVLAAIGAVVGVYILDNEGTAGEKTRRGLIALIVAEIAVAVLFGGFGFWTGLGLVAAFGIAGLFLVYLLENLAHFWAARTPAQRRLKALASWAWHALFAGIGVIHRVWRVLALVALVGGVFVVFYANQWWQVVVWAVVTLVITGAWNVVGHAPVRRVLAIALIAYGVTALIRYEPTLAIATGAAIALGALNLSVAKATSDRFTFYGVSVFLSVVLFGGALSFVRTREHPKLQAVAVLFKNGTPPACGLYVTETDSRLYLARVSAVPRGRGVRVADKSGRLFWLPRDQIERTELGPLQGIVRAQEDGADLRDELIADRSANTTPAQGTEGTPAQAAQTQGTQAQSVQAPPTQAQSTPAAPTQTQPTPAQSNPAKPTPAQPTQPQPTPGSQPLKGAVASAAAANECVPGRATPPPRKTPQRTLAQDFQPRLVVDRLDGFWPISALTIFKLSHGNRRTCRNVADSVCPNVTRASELPWTGGGGEWLEYPGGNTNIGQQHDDMVSALRSPDPVKTAREYFLVTEPGPKKTISLQYWFYYAFNYQRLGLGGVPIGSLGFHEGDFETVGVLLSRDKQPVYAWMARHDTEGRPFVWDESALGHPGGHLSVYAARGSHASYESCTTQHRPRAPAGLINDRPQCDATQQLTLEPSLTPLSDLALAPWGCWRGRFGHATRGQRLPLAAQAFADGPLSPLWQQTFDGGAKPCAAVETVPERPDVGEEVLDDGTAGTLREHAGRLDGRFNSCADWRKPPASGIYVVACNDQALKDFFDSGLEDMGDQQLSIRGSDGRHEKASVPAVYRRVEQSNLDGLIIKAAKTTTATVYAVCYSGERPIEANFAAVPLKPGQAPVLHTGAGAWTLSASGGTVTATMKTTAKTNRCDSHT
jgi:hypothetical protein